MTNPNSSKVILILDDEEAIRNLFSEALKGASYEVITSGSGEDAMKQMRRHPVDLLITDLVMPGQEGLETIRLARKQFPNLKILAISGYAGDTYLHPARLLGAAKTLTKPIDIDLLCETVREMLAPPEGEKL